MKKIKNYWNNFVGKVLAKLANLFNKLHKNWQLHQKRKNFDEGTKRMLEIVDYMENRSLLKEMKNNEHARTAINKADKKFSINFQEMRERIIAMESKSRDNVEDVIVEKTLERVKSLPKINSNPVNDLIEANPDRMSDAQFINLLEELKSKNVISEKQTVPLNYES